jgi:rhamnogalacturonyl hydrolase YesR
MKKIFTLFFHFPLTSMYISTQNIVANNRMKRIKSIFLTAVVGVCLLSCSNRTDYFNFPAGATPEEIGKKLSLHFLPAGKWTHYAEVCTWLGALRFAEATADSALIRRLRERFDILLHAETSILPRMNHVDSNMFGCLPLEFYQVTKDRRYFDLGMPYADTQWLLPENANEKQRALAARGLSWQTRMWIDDMFMIIIIQSQAYRASGKREYIDRAAREMVVYLDSLQQPNGLFFHAPDTPFFWARGNGWMAAGMTELLRCLPEDNPDRPRILKGYLTMMENLKSFQSESGMWRQLIDAPDCWPETSGTAMFAYSMITGVKCGWLPTEEYVPTARKAWLALVSYIDDKGDVTEVCVGTNKLNDRQYYYDRPRVAGDYHGQAPVLWCAGALLMKTSDK